MVAFENAVKYVMRAISRVFFASKRSGSNARSMHELGLVSRDVRQWGN